MPTKSDRGWTLAYVVAVTAILVALVGQDTPARPSPTIAGVAPTGVYGSGVAVDSKHNEHLGWIDDDNKVSHRFRATQSSAVTKIALNFRGGTVYSQGDGGIVRVGIQGDVNGKPSGTYVGSTVSFRPGNPAGNWENQDPRNWAGGPTLSAGTIYHLVIDNIHPDPINNAVSINETWVFGSTGSPRQPAFSDDFAVLTAGPGQPWTVVAGDTPVHDITYANGRHDGNAYFGNILSRYGLISGVQKVRERFTVSGSDRTITKAYVRVGRQAGSGPLTIRLETGSGALIEQRSVDASTATRYTPGADARNGDWFGVTFANAHTLVAGQTYNLVVSTDASTQYSMIPIRENSTSESASVWGAFAFRDGWAQKTTDGSTWEDMYPWAPVDLQFYLTDAVGPLRSQAGSDVGVRSGRMGPRNPTW